MSANASSADRLPNILSIFFILLGAYLVPPSFQTLYRIQTSQEWPVIEGRVISAELERRWPDRKPSQPQEYLARVWFSYSVVGESFVAKTLRFTQKYSPDKRSIEEQLSRYPVGARIDVRVSPGDPSVVVVEKSAVPVGEVLKLGLGGLFLITGVLALLGFFFQGKNEA